MDLEFGDSIIGDGVRKRVDPGLGSSGKQSPKKEQPTKRKKFLHGLPVIFVFNPKITRSENIVRWRFPRAMLLADAAILRQFDSSSKLAGRMQT